MFKTGVKGLKGNGNCQAEQHISVLVRASGYELHTVSRGTTVLTRV